MWKQLPDHLALIVISVTLGQSLLLAQDRRISTDEARQLVLQVFKKYGPVVEVWQLKDSYDQSFLYFEAYWPNPTGSGNLGSYAVNPWTAEVWHADGCRRVISAELKRIQGDIRKRLGLTKQKHLILDRRPPLCEPLPTPEVEPKAGKSKKQRK